MEQEKQKKAKSADQSEQLPKQTSPLIFISHDNRDSKLAEEFSRLLTSVSAGVLKSFRSSDRKGSQGIEYGVEWYPELMSRLDIASDVVCLLTQRSLDRPWILYEAGVAKGKLKTPVHGIALGIPLNRANTGPFAQFQNCDDKEDSLTQLVIQLLERVPNSEPNRDAIKMQVKAFKEKEEEILKGLGDPKAQNETEVVDETSVAKLFEEVKVMFQDLPSRVESKLSDAVDPIKHRRLRRMHPMLVEELLHRPVETGEPFQLVIIFSLFRDELPWLYEIGMDLYRTIKTGNEEEIEEAIINLQHVMHDIPGPIMEELVYSRETMMLLHELPRMLDMFVRNYLRKSKKMTRPKKIRK